MQDEVEDLSSSFLCVYKPILSLGCHTGRLLPTHSWIAPTQVLSSLFPSLLSHRTVHLDVTFSSLNSPDRLSPTSVDWEWRTTQGRDEALGARKACSEQGTFHLPEQFLLPEVALLRDAEDTTELSRLNHPRLGWECSEYTPALQNQASSWELNVPGKKSLTGKEEGRTDTVRHTTRVFSCFSSIADHQKQGFRLLETDQVAALYLQPLCLLWCLFHGIVKSFAADPVCIFSCFSLVLSAKIRKCSTILFLPQMSVCSLSCRSYSKQKLTHK